MSDDYIDTHYRYQAEKAAGNTPHSLVGRQAPVSACQGNVSRRETSVISDGCLQTGIGRGKRRRGAGSEPFDRAKRLFGRAVNTGSLVHILPPGDLHPPSW